MAKSGTYGPGIGLPESSIAAGSVDSVLVGVRHGPAKLSRRRRPFLFGVELVERSDARDASLAQRRGAYLWALSSSRPARRAKGLFSSKTGEAPLEGTYSCGPWARQAQRDERSAPCPAKVRSERFRNSRCQLSMVLLAACGIRSRHAGRALGPRRLAIAHRISR